MIAHRWTALVTIVAMLVYLGMAINVARARGKTGIEPPAMTGDPLLERAVRVQANTLEWIVPFVAGLWLFALYVNELWAAALGVVWIVGRLVYSAGYMAAPAKRSAGFLIQFVAVAILLLGGAARIAYGLFTG